MFNENEVKASVALQKHVYDFASFFHPHIASITNHTSARSFCFRKYGNDLLPKMMYKTISGDDQWKGIQVENIEHSMPITILTTCPHGSPVEFPPKPLDADIIKAIYNNVPLKAGMNNVARN